MTHPPHSTESAEAGARRAEIMRAERMDAEFMRSFQRLAKKAQTAHEIRCRCDAAYAANWQVMRSILSDVADATKRQSGEPPPDVRVMQRPSDTMYATERHSGAPPSPDGLRTPAEAARKPRRPTLASVAKQANKAAIVVARYEVKPDGTVVIVTGQGESTEPKNPWLAEPPKETKQ